MLQYFEAFVLLGAVIDPIGTLPVFIAITRGRSEAEQHRIARRAVLIAGGILLGFIAVGQPALALMNVPLAAFQISGGLILFLFALTMVFGEGKPQREIDAEPHAHDLAVFPLAVPSIASPGAMMAVVLLTDNARYSFVEQAVTTLILVLILLITLLLLLAAPRLHRLLGDSGASIVSRVMGLILASVATTHVLQGIQAYFRMSR